MSVCNYTQLVTPNTCLGDSLATFNSNFSSLDEALCRQPDIVGGNGVHTEVLISEQMHNAIEVSINNSFVYGTTFEFVSAATTQPIHFNNGQSIMATSLPYISSTNLPAPLVTFSAISPTRSAPKVSIFWTASGTNTSTVYMTNSATAFSTDIGTSKLNGSVTSLLSSGNYIYIGGEFTALGNSTCRKLAIINPNGGTPHPLFPFTIGTAGGIIGTELSADGGFGNTGTINAIVEWNEYVIFGGTYQSLVMGRGLTIYDRVAEKIYPFYVNGDVNCLTVAGNDLYIGGTFDYINYLGQSASVISGLRRYTNGIAKINLSLFQAFPNSSISTIFGTNISKAFSNLSTINAIAVKSNIVYMGGLFNAYAGTNLIASNLAIVNGDGTISNSWSPVVGGEVFTLAVDGNYLYAGGNIRSFHTVSQFFAAPRKLDVAYNAISFDVTLASEPVYQYNWKPKFNGSVSKFAFHNSDLSTFVYCYGNFTQVNGVDAHYLAAVDKSFNNTKDGQSYVLWKNNVEKPPGKINNALIRSKNFLIIGGSFEKINEVSRPYLAKINGVYETLSTDLLKVINWTFGAQLCSPGSSLALNLTNFVSTSAFPGTYGTVNQTTFSPEYTSNIFKNYGEGSLLRFFVRRMSSLDTLTTPAHIIGWKVDFN